MNIVEHSERYEATWWCYIMAFVVGWSLPLLALALVISVMGMLYCFYRAASV